MFFIFIWRAMLMTHKARDRLGSLLRVGIISMYTFYGIVNMGMVIGMMPCTGHPACFCLQRFLHRLALLGGRPFVLSCTSKIYALM